MKKDISDLKGLIFELINANDLNISDVNSLVSLQAESYPRYNADVAYPTDRQGPSFNPQPVKYAPEAGMEEKPNTLVINHPNGEHFNTAEIVEGSMSLEDMEKEMINKALKKHNSKRKEAADDLGISERTLYRKIKQYDIPL